MKTIKIALLVAISIIGIQATSLAQKSKVYGIEVEVGQFSGVNANGDSTYNHKAKIYLLDSLDLYKVYIKTGTGFMGSDVYNDSYNFYLGQGETNPTNITRDGLKLTVDLGAVVPRFFFWEIVTENLNNVKYLPYRKQL